MGVDNIKLVHSLIQLDIMGWHQWLPLKLKREDLTGLDFKSLKQLGVGREYVQLSTVTIKHHLDL